MKRRKIYGLVAIALGVTIPIGCGTTGSGGCNALVPLKITAQDGTAITFLVSQDAGLSASDVRAEASPAILYLGSANALAAQSRLIIVYGPTAEIIGLARVTAGEEAVVSADTTARWLLTMCPYVAVATNAQVASFIELAPGITGYRELVAAIATRQRTGVAVVDDETASKAAQIARQTYSFLEMQNSAKGAATGKSFNRPDSFPFAGDGDPGNNGGPWIDDSSGTIQAYNNKLMDYLFEATDRASGQVALSQILVQKKLDWLGVFNPGTRSVTPLALSDGDYDAEIGYKYAWDSPGDRGRIWWTDNVRLVWTVFDLITGEAADSGAFMQFFQTNDEIRVAFLGLTGALKTVRDASSGDATKASQDAIKLILKFIENMIKIANKDPAAVAKIGGEKFLKTAFFVWKAYDLVFGQAWVIGDYLVGPENLRLSFRVRNHTLHELPGGPIIPPPSVSPVIATIPNTRIPVGQPYTSSAPSLTQGTGPIIWSLVVYPSDMTINASTGVVMWQNPRIGQYLITTRATNSVGSDDATWQLNVDATLDTYEPDNDWSNAKTIVTGSSQTHSIVPASDVDWVRFTLSTVSDVLIETSGSAGDTRVWLYDSGLNQIGYDDDSGTGAFSRLAEGGLASGTYYVKIDEYGNNAEIASYQILLTVTPSQQTGSCCAVDGSCTPTTSLNCSGTWTQGASCSPNPCQQALTWTQRNPTNSPSPRYDHAMAYDSVRGKTVLFGGYTGSKNDETWEWNGTTWTPLNPPTRPSARSEHAMAYDSARGKTVLFGGVGVYTTDRLDDTWEWNGSTWTPRSFGGPSSRYGHAMAFDSARGKTVLFGGFDGSIRGDTWEWNGTTWTPLSPANSPTARWYHAMAYDSTRGVTVLFGGNLYLGDTWEWNGTNWTQPNPATSPPERSDHAMAYDSARGLTVMFGGWGFVSGGNTWEWNGTTWTQRSSAPNPSRVEHSMAYDSARGVTVLFGGNGSSYLADTWEYSPSP